MYLRTSVRCIHKSASYCFKTFAIICLPHPLISLAAKVILTVAAMTTPAPGDTGLARGAAVTALEAITCRAKAGDVFIQGTLTGRISIPGKCKLGTT